MPDSPPPSPAQTGQHCPQCRCNNRHPSQVECAVIHSGHEESMCNGCSGLPAPDAAAIRLAALEEALRELADQLVIDGSTGMRYHDCKICTANDRKPYRKPTSFNAVEHEPSCILAAAPAAEKEKPR